jgi:hypothetical protein
MAQDEAQVYGYVEKVTIADKNLTVSAKLDTGAKSASLHAIDIKDIEVKGIPYLRFKVPTKEGVTIVEAQYVGKVKIKVRNSEANPALLKATPMKRPVVLLKLKLGGKERLVRVNLTNRKRFLYPLLLGRDAIIEFNGTVNPALTFTTKPKSA